MPISQKCFSAVLNPGAVFGEIEADDVGDARAAADGGSWLMREASSVDLRSRPRCVRAARNALGEHRDRDPAIRGRT